MAEIDFSNAVFEPINNTQMNPYMSLKATTNLSYSIRDAGAANSLTSSLTMQILVDNVNEFVYAFVGVMNPSVVQTPQTEMYLSIGSGSSWTNYWKISNISFTGGDSFAFQIKAQFT